MDNIPYGYCHCGCGEKTPLAKQTRSGIGHVKGEPVKYLVSHATHASLATRKANAEARHPARFWAKVQKADGCWEWTATKNTHGYGTYKYRGRTCQAHRIAYELLKGPIPDGLEIDHLCRNRGCQNPEHMETVTGRVNTLRGYGISGVNARKTHCPKGHEFTEENTYFHRGKRICKECNRTRAREWWRKKHKRN